MNLYSLSIRRPVLATVMSIVIVLFGVISFTDLGVREFPSVDPPVISVTTNYRGANADVIESQITEPLEESLNSIDGIRTMTSTSSEGRSSISVEFELGADLERAANDVRDRASRAMRQLPQETEPPVVSKADADTPPIVFLNISSESRDLLELSRLAEDLFKERLQTIQGVSSVDVWGEKRYSMRVWMDPQQLAAHELSPMDVQEALQRENVELPSGSIEGNQLELSVRAMSRLESVEEYNDLIIKQVGDRNVRLRDIGYARLGPENQRTVLKRDGVSMVGVVLRPQPGANYIGIVDEFYNRLDRIRLDVPDDVDLGIGFDTTEYIRQSVTEAQQTIFIALLLVVLVIFLFLREWRTTLIPIVVIPVALIGSFFIMYAAGFSINVLTLLALVLAIGIVVDDAIVVVEVIYAKIEEGKHPLQAGIQGTGEIFYAVIATTLALVSVFLPILFMGGLTGRLFREFGMVLAGTVVISSFVALTLTPMLSTKLLKHREVHPWFYRKTEPFFEWMARKYRNSLEWFMNRRWLAFPLLLGSVALAVVLFNVLPQELAPLEDRSRVRIFATGPEGATFDYMDEYVDRLLGKIREEVPEREAVISVTSPGFGTASANSAFGFVILEPPSERERSQMEVADILSEEVQELTRARAFVSQEQTISTSRGGMPVQYVIQAPTIERLRETLPEFLEAARQDETFTFVDVNLKFTKPELRVEINRNRASQLGVSATDIARTLSLALSEQRVGDYIMDGEQYQVIAQVERSNRNDPLDLQSLYVRNNRGEPVQLSNLVTVTEANSPPQLFHFNRYLSATVSAQPAPGETIGTGIAAMDEIAGRTLDETFTTSLSGPSRDFVESSSSLMFVFLLALALVYLVLAAQFESFRDPFTIMLTVPLALLGALLALWYFDQTINIFSQIGMIMLVGLVTKNGILIVEFANQRKVQGLSISEAILDGAAARFRPVLMTTISTVLGILPIALALGAGAQSRIPMGIAVIGGMLVGTFFTLYIIPAVYSYLTSVTAGPLTVDEAMDGGNGAGVVPRTSESSNV
jgi:multidrug efflux pump